jgi:hypothetical protein
MGVSLSQGVGDLIGWGEDVAKQFYDSALKYAGFVVFLWGLFVAVQKREKKITIVFFLLLAVFMIFVIRSGNNFARHAYYVVPFVPVMALVAGYGLSRIKWKKAAMIILAMICFENLANQYHDFRIAPESMRLLHLEESLDKYSSRKDRIAINSGGNTTPMYFAHRKGWSTDNQHLKNPDFRKDLSSKGCRLVLIMKKKFGTPVDLPLPLLEENADWSIYRLSKGIE